MMELVTIKNGLEKEFLDRRQQDGVRVRDLISSGPSNLAGYLSNHSEHTRIQPEI